MDKENLEGKKVLMIEGTKYNPYLSIRKVAEHKWIKIKEHGGKFEAVWLYIDDDEDETTGYIERQNVYTFEEIANMFYGDSLEKEIMMNVIKR